MKTFDFAIWYSVWIDRKLIIHIVVYVNEEGEESTFEVDDQ